MMKKIPLTTKISIVSVFLMIVSIMLLGFYFDTFLKKNYFNDSKNKISHAKNRLLIDLKTTQDSLKKGVEFIQADKPLIASIDLINNYQDKQNYNSVLLDEEKKDIAKKLLEKVKISFNTSIKLYDKNEELIAYVYLDEKGYKLNFISYEDSKAFLFSKYENESDYEKNIYMQNELNPFKHVRYYTQPELKKNPIITYHFIQNTLYISSHKSIFDNHDESNTVLHIEMTKSFDSSYFDEVSKSLNMNIFLSEDNKYEKISSEFFSRSLLHTYDVDEKSNGYFSAFFIPIKDKRIYIVFSLDKLILKSVLDENRKQLVVFLFIAVLIMFLLFRFFVKRGLSRPLDKLMAQIDKIKSGDYSNSIMVKTSDEFEVISENINKLAESVKNREKKLEFLSTHDELTGLFNRRKLTEMLEHAIKRAKRNGTHLAVLFLDLDQFKQVNDTLGHSVGDTLLKAVANRLNSSLRESDVIARVGGDEFNIFVEGFKNIGELQLFAQKILDDFEEPFVDSENEIITSTSIGISVYPDDGSDAETLIKNADLAMYMSKDRGRNNYSFYAINFSESLQKRMEIVHALKSAIKSQNEFMLYYQPKISIKTQKIVGVEALIRWNSHQLGFIRPDEFISIAEDTHLIIDIGKWVVNKACKDFVSLRENGYIIKQIAINISGIQLQYSDLLTTVKDALYTTNMPAENLELEVTESYIATNEQAAVDTLSDFRKMGIGLAIDDFGTGYSSMSYLQKLPITRLKIDKAFVDDLPHSKESIAVVKAIIALAEAFNLKITVEGVETQEQLEFFKDKYCDDIQGYIYSKPLSFDELKEFIKNNS